MITRHFATIDGRDVHYRRAGEGPPVLLIHPSLRSSDVFIEFIEQLSAEFTVIAPDTPGYGFSQPLREPAPDVSDYADSFIQLIDTLGIKNVGVYGFLTGSCIAMDLAKRYSNRIAVAVLNNYLLFSEEEREDYLANFAPELRLSWDGSHLSWVWARIREQAIFFPWHRRPIESRVDADLPDANALHGRAINFLRTGTKYHLGPQSVFRFNASAALNECTVPTLLIYPAERPRNVHYARLPRLRPNITAEQIEGVECALARVVAMFEAYPGSFDAAAATQISDSALSNLVSVNGRYVHLQRYGQRGRPLLVLHGDAGAVAGLQQECEGFAGERQVIAIDLPGHGLSDKRSGNTRLTIQRNAYTVLAILKKLGISDTDIAAFEGGINLALQLCKDKPSLVSSLGMIAPLYPPAPELPRYMKSYAPRIKPEWSGGYLLAAWHFIRDQRLFDPWFDKTKEAIVWEDPQVDNARVHQMTTDLLQCIEIYQGNYARSMRFPTCRISAAVHCPAVIGTGRWNPRDRQAVALSRSSGLPLLELGKEPGDWSKMWDQRIGRR